MNKILNRVGYTCLVYFLDDSKQIFFDFLKKCTTAALGTGKSIFVVLRVTNNYNIYTILGYGFTVYTIIFSFIYHALLLPNNEQIFYKSNYKFLRYVHYLS